MWITLDTLGSIYTPVGLSWRLNERHYGALQGLNKAETAAKFGDEQVLVWRRAYAIAPEPLDLDDPRHPRFDRRSEEHTSELQSLMRISYAVFCLKKQHK